MLLMCCLISIVSCTTPSPKTVETKATAKGCSDAFITEHNDLFAENIRLKAALKICQGKSP
jgi:hypothetical protein